MSNRIKRLIINIAALCGRTKEERRKIRMSFYDDTSAYNQQRMIFRFSEAQIFSRAQDLTFPSRVRNAEKIMIIVVPEHDAMSGGIYSMFSIANQMHRLRMLHGYEVVVMTRPNPTNHTYIRLSAFRNSETVYRFDQIMLCDKAKEIYIHLPEYVAADFYRMLPMRVIRYLRLRQKLRINIMNQNIDLMPELSEFSDLFKLTPEISQSVAHHSYFDQENTDGYGIPALILPAYTDLSEYPSSSFDQKKKLIIYSLDDANHKKACLDMIAAKLPDFSLVEIRDMTFDTYMEYATNCMFSITFGEGFDGYLAQPIYQGGIGFALYNNNFFPSPNFKDYFNIFSSAEEMVDQICDRIRTLSNNKNRYVELNAALRLEYEKLYSYDEYVKQIEKLALCQFELWPAVPAALPSS